MYNKIYKLGFIALIFMSSCKQMEVAKHENEKTVVEVQGHRGDRGSFPENSIPAFMSAIKKGADVIELDVVISKDNKVVVSHEPFMSSSYVIAPNGVAITKDKEKSFNLYTMTYDSIRKFDTGSNGNKSFPEQKKMKTYKPLLSEMIDSIEGYISAHKLKHIRYNIEIKSGESEYGIFQPEPKEFVKLVMQVVNDKKISKLINVQSFDPEILNAMHAMDPKIRLAILTGAPGIAKNLDKLNFVPQIYSPHYKLVNPQFIDTLKSKNMRVIPWTVNDNKDIDAMLAFKVDGIITDYPERVIEKLN